MVPRYTKSIFTLLIFSFVLLFACKNDKKEQETVDKPMPKPKTNVKIPRFDRDSAYHFIEKQVAFGPRVPNSNGHKACKEWMVAKLKSYGADVIEQDFVAQAYTGEKLNSTNIIAQFNPDHKNRVILAAHWDTRPFADSPHNSERVNEAILGADDGGSGVGVLIEIARQIQQNPIDLGVDIILFDSEDYGDSEGGGNTYCLGSQHWGKNPHRSGYRAKFGILLDMVGAKGARFPKEGVSMNFAPQIMNKVWKYANQMGYGAYFVNQRSSPVTDDHLFVNELTGIPMIDIINKTNNGFGAHWHTHDDNMSIIDKRTLRASGQTVLAVIYRESSGSF